MYPTDADYDDAALRRGLYCLALRSPKARERLGGNFTRVSGVTAQLTFDSALDAALGDPDANWEPGELESLLQTSWVLDESGEHVPISTFLAD
jgi:hypothetical protein